jgi:hypothetical protein
VTRRASLDTVPDQKLLAGLRPARGHGRDDYPVERLGRVALLTIALRRPPCNACLAERHRNPALCRLLGRTAFAQIPNGWKGSRFLDVLGAAPRRTARRGVFDHLTRRLGLAVPDRGRHTAGDATALSARPPADPKAVAAATAQGLPPPPGGRKEYRADGGRVVKVVEGFGYKLHLLVDVRHEGALAYGVTDPKAGDNERVGALVEQAQANRPAGRIETLASDQAADDEKGHEVLHGRGVKPAIQDRALGPQDGGQENVLPGGRYPLRLVYDEAGTVPRYGPVSDPPVRHRRAYLGYAHDRDCVKYRCPARHEGWGCPSAAHCNGGRAAGLSARIPCELDWRRLPPIPRATTEFERRYKGRTAAGRVNARLKLFWGAGEGNGAGARRFHGFVGAVLVVQLVFATLVARVPRGEGAVGQTRRGPIARARHEPELAEAG